MDVQIGADPLALIAARVRGNTRAYLTTLREITQDNPDRLDALIGGLTAIAAAGITMCAAQDDEDANDVIQRWLDAS